MESRKQESCIPSSRLWKTQLHSEDAHKSEKPCKCSQRRESGATSRSIIVTYASGKPGNDDMVARMPPTQTSKGSQLKVVLGSYYCIIIIVLALSTKLRSSRPSLVKVIRAATATSILTS
jgi:cadmium resistance protein CadD (predicted permease)